MIVFARLTDILRLAQSHNDIDPAINHTRRYPTVIRISQQEFKSHISLECIHAINTLQIQGPGSQKPQKSKFGLNPISEPFVY